jgi:hypothetical protein
MRRWALLLRERADRAVERLEWLGAFEHRRRLPAEKWVYRRLAAERARRSDQAVTPRQRPDKWLAAVVSEHARTAELRNETKPS